MTPRSFRKGALASLSLVLLGCASMPAAKNAATAPTPVPAHTLTDNASDASALAMVPGNVDGAVKQAQAQRKSGDLAGAARTLSQLVLVAPDDARVLGEYGKTLLAQGRGEDALAFLDRAIELQPNDWSLFSAQGVAFDQKGDFPAAQKAYSRALALKPGDPTVLSNNAFSHVLAGDLQGAEDLLMQASRDGTEFPQIESNLALVRSLKASRPLKTRLEPAKVGNAEARDEKATAATKRLAKETAEAAAPANGQANDGLVLRPALSDPPAAHR